MADPSCELRKGGWVVRFVVFAIALVAFSLSSHAVNSCRYLVTEPDGAAIGLFYYEDASNVDGVCQSIGFLKDASDVDIFADEDSWKVAQGLGSAGSALGGITVLFMFLGFFCKWCAYRMCFKFLFPLMLITAGICTVLTNVVFDNDMCDDIKNGLGEVTTKRACIAADGNSAAGTAFVLYWVAGISMFWCLTPWEEPMYKFVNELSSVNVETAETPTPEKVVEPTEGLEVNQELDL